jgi:hypothetical protein
MTYEGLTREEYPCCCAYGVSVTSNCSCDTGGGGTITLLACAMYSIKVLSTAFASSVPHASHAIRITSIGFLMGLRALRWRLITLDDESILLLFLQLHIKH